MKHVIDVLREARELIADPKHHCKYAYGECEKGNTTDPRWERCTRFCSIGSVQRAVYGVWKDGQVFTREETERQHSLITEAMQLLHECRDERYACIADVNDLGGHAKALEMFDRAIEAAKGKDAETGGEG
jgi:hypothetical protein